MMKVSPLSTLSLSLCRTFPLFPLYSLTSLTGADAALGVDIFGTLYRLIKGLEARPGDVQGGYLQPAQFRVLAETLNAMIKEVRGVLVVTLLSISSFVPPRPAPTPLPHALFTGPGSWREGHCVLRPRYGKAHSGAVKSPRPNQGTRSARWHQLQGHLHGGA